MRLSALYLNARGVFNRKDSQNHPRKKLSTPSKQRPESGFRLGIESLELRVVPARPLPFPMVFVGSGGNIPGVVPAYDAETGKLNFERSAFGFEYSGGVNVAAGDITGDGFPDAILAPSEGGGPRVRVLDGKSGEQIKGPLGDFFAYDEDFRGGVSIAAGDVNADGTPDLITAAGIGGGPHIKVFDGRSGALLHSFFALEPEFRGGINVAAADFTDDGRAEIVVGAGPGGGPRVRTLSVDSGEPITGPLGDFFSGDPEFRGGVFVGTDAVAGDVDADEMADLVVGSGVGTEAAVTVYSGRSGAVLSIFSPFESGTTSGIKVATAFVTDDANADVIVGTGSGTVARIALFNGMSGELLKSPLSELTLFSPEYSGGIGLGASNDPPVPLQELTYINEGITVTSRVYYSYSGYDGQMYWEYEVTNDSFPWSEPDDGFVNFWYHIEPWVIAEVIESGTSNPDFIPQFTIVPGLPAPLGLISWQTTWEHQYVPAGNSATFWYTTPPLGIKVIASTSGNKTRQYHVQHEVLAPAEPVVDIDIDVNRDKTITNSKPPLAEDAEGSADEKTEFSIGTIVMADKDSVYVKPGVGAEIQARAQRRELLVSSDLPANSPVKLKRGQNNIRLFTEKSNDIGGDSEIAFDGTGEATVSSGKSYWIQGGDTPSSAVRGTVLQVRPNLPDSMYQDAVAVTVLWVDISTRNSPDDEWSPVGIYEDSVRISSESGYPALGVAHNQVDEGFLSKTRRTHGNIEIHGSILPPDFNTYDPATPMPLLPVEPTNGPPRTLAAVSFGFVFHRFMDIKRYYDAQAKAETRTGNDDSFFNFQDVTPDKSGGKLLIVDGDNPSVGLFERSREYGAHGRMNFNEHVTFNYYPNEPERVSLVRPWSVTMDTAFDYDGNAVSIYDPKNNGEKANEVYGDHLLPNLNLNAPLATLTTASTLANNDKNLPNGTTVTIVIQGTNLMGYAYLVDGTFGLPAYQAKTFRVKKTAQAPSYSDLTEVRATFGIGTTLAAGTHLDLVITNEAGSSNLITDFIIT